MGAGRAGGRVLAAHLGGVLLGAAHVDVDGGHVVLSVGQKGERVTDRTDPETELQSLTHTSRATVRARSGSAVPCRDRKRATAKRKKLSSSSWAVLSHHLEDDSGPLPLAGPEHHSVIWSHEVHRVQNL